MLRGMKALLEAIDEQAEHHAQQQAESAARKGGNCEEQVVVLENRMEGVAEAAVVVVDDKHVNGRGAGTPHPADECLLRASEVPPLFPAFPTQPPAFSTPFVDGQSHSGVNSIHMKGSDAPSLQDHMVNVSSSVAAPSTVGLNVRLMHPRQRDEEFDALVRDVRRHKAAAEAAKQELLQRSLRVHELEDAVRDVKERFDEHKAKSRCLLEEKQREYKTLRRHLEAKVKSCEVDGDNSAAGDGEDDALVVRERVEKLEAAIASAEQERELLQAQVARCRRELLDAHEQRTVAAQQVDFLRLDLRVAQEALESEVAAHHQSRVLLQGRQRELNELRAAVEKNGGTFTAAGSLVALRGSDGNSCNEALLSRQLLERQNALEVALRDAAEWRRRYERATQRLEEHTTRVSVLSSHSVRDAADSRPVLLRGASQTNVVLQRVFDFIAAVDAAALRLGKVMRRQHVLRVFIVLYVLCLHGWIGILMLMTSRTLDSTYARSLTAAGT